ncbi:MAG: hypothetical protein ACP5IB_09870 [Thermoplasmata archaeon]
MKFEINDQWKNLLAEKIKRYLIGNSTTEYTITYIDHSPIYFPKRNTDTFIFAIGIDITEEYEKIFGKTILERIYEILRASPMLSLIRGKVFIWNSGTLDKIDLFKYPDFKNIENDQFSHFNEITKSINLIFGRINLLVYLTGKDISKTTRTKYPIIWIFTKDELNTDYGEKIYVFKSVKN